MGFEFGFCRLVIGLWALLENNALQLVSRSARNIGYKSKPNDQVYCQLSISQTRRVKAETHDVTNHYHTSPRQVAATNLLVWHVKIIVAATEFCRCDLSHEFELVWISATYCSDKMSASCIVAVCLRICDKSLRQNLNQPMREHQLVSRHVGFELVYISSLPKSIACTEQVSHCSDLS